jgi:Mg-chelatase subunit ChlD
MKALKNSISIVILFFSFCVNSQADDFITSGVNAERFPTIEKAFFVIDNSGNQLSDFNSSDFEIFENRQLIHTDSVSVDCYSYQAPVQVLLLIDQSNSMREEVDGSVKIEKVKESVRSFIDDIYLSAFSSVGIAVFSSSVELICPFTDDKDYLKTKLEKVNSVNASTDFNTAFLDDEAGGVELLKERPDLNRIIIFLTDGKHSTEWQGPLQENKITSRLRQANIELYSITFLEDYNEPLSRMSKATGGYYYNIKTADELPELYKLLANGLTQSSYCVLTWQSDLYCDKSPRPTDVDITYLPANLIDKDFYIPPPESVFDAGFSRETYYFGNPQPGNSTTLTIPLKPTPYDYYIENISLDDEIYFEIIDYGDGTGNNPGKIKISGGTEHFLKVKFTQISEDISRKTKLRITGYPCDSEIDLFGGKGNLIITNPNKDDIFSICSGTEIRWEGIASETEVELYSKLLPDGEFELIKSNAKYLHHGWQIPDIPGKYVIYGRAELNNGSGDYLEAYSDTFEIVIPEITSLYEKLFVDTLLIGSSKSKFFTNTFYNSGKTDIEIVNMYFSGVSADDFTLLDYGKRKLSPGDSSTLEIEFVAGDDNIRRADLIVVPDCGQQISIPVEGWGICKAESKDTLEIETTYVDERKDSLFKAVIRNPMSNPITFTVYLSGIDKNEFYISNLYQGQKVTLNPGEEFDLKITFRPESIGEKIAIINFSIEGCNNSQTYIKSKAVLQGLKVNDIDFGRKRHVSLYDTLSVKLINLDPFPVQVDSVAITSNNSVYRALSLPTDSTLAGNDTITVDVVFYPDMPIKYLDSLGFFINSTDTIFAEIKGESFLPRLHLEAICNGDVIFGDTSEVKLFIINPGAETALHIDTCYFNPETPEFFLPDTSFFPEKYILPPGDTLEVVFGYTPLEDMNHAGRISVWGDNYTADFDTTSKENIASFSCDVVKYDYTLPDFRETVICQKDTSDFRIFNQSVSSDLTIFLSEAVISGSGMNAFSLLFNQDIVLQGGADTPVQIIYSSSQPGELYAELLIPTSADEPIRIDLYSSSFTMKPSFERNMVEYFPGDYFQQKLKITVPEFSKGYIDTLGIQVNLDMFSCELDDSRITQIISSNSEDEDYLIFSSIEYDKGKGILKAYASGHLKEGKTYELFILDIYGLLPQERQTEMSYTVLYPCTSSIDTANASIIAQLTCAGESRYVEISGSGFFCKEPYPVPAGEAILLDFGIGYETNVSFELFDISGKSVGMLYERTLAPGEYSETINIPTEIANGTYNLIFKAGEFSKSFSVLIER